MAGGDDADGPVDADAGSDGPAQSGPEAVTEDPPEVEPEGGTGTGNGGDPPGDGPGPDPGGSPGDDGGSGPVRAFLDSDDPVVETVREVLSSVLMVVAFGLVLFALSGVWPPLVAVESGSMEPHMHKGDLVFVMESGRFSPGESADTAVVTYREGRDSGYQSFGDYGNVVVYRPNGRDGTPIIHRAMFYVEPGDNWVAMANDSYLGGITSCDQVSNCPAEHAGYVTKGDANGAYDQAVGRSRVVRPRWVRGVAKVRAPLLGCIRLELAGNSCLG